jgi:hypothetical protein
MDFFSLQNFQAFLEAEFPESPEGENKYLMDPQYYFDLRIIPFETFTAKQQAQGVTAQILKRYAFP